MATFLSETAHGVSEVRDKAYHLSLGRIWLRGEITEDLAADFVSQLMWLEDLAIPATIYIDSVGGDVSAGLTIIDTLENATIPVDIVCIGKAFSMGAMILSCGKKGHRFCLKNAKIMLHQPFTGGVGGTASNLRERADSLLKTQTTLTDLLIEHTGHTRKTVEKDISFDHYFSASEAKSYGLIDFVGFPNGNR